MHPLALVAYAFGGALLMNAVPHIVAATTGRAFPTPFAKPPGKGLSSPIVNMLWGFANLVGAYLLLLHIGRFDPRDWPDAAACGLGMLLIGLQLSRHFGAIDDGRGSEAR